MSGISGVVNFEKDISDLQCIKRMSKTLLKRGDKDDYYFSKNCVMSVRSINDNNRFVSYKIDEVTYSIVIDGEIYNKKELLEKLKENGFVFKTESDSEVFIKAYVFYGKDVCEYINGVFAVAIWNDKKKELFVARDRFGIRPIYYSVYDNHFIYGSEIKTVLEFPGIETVVNKEGLCEILSVGPCHTPGKTIFKDIFELKPATFVVYNQNGFFEEKYWTLESKVHTDTIDETADNIRYLLKDSIKKQMNYDDNFGVLLSGGLDSSIIAKFANVFYKEKTGKSIKTFSVDYKDQEKNFVKNDFQPNTDNYYIDIMKDFLNLENAKIELDTPELAAYLEEAMVRRDYPGMADVDSSYLLLFNKLKGSVNTVLSGECSDEIFGGYPWYFKDELMNSGTFPWSNALTERQNLLNKELTNKVDLKEYANFRYNEELEKIEFAGCESLETKKHKELMSLTMNWFMQTLIDRTDRMCMYSTVGARVPFCDYRLVEYAWNIPWEMKAYKGREKGLLRYSMEGYLPEEVIYRKKSPYPKTHNPNYLDKVCKMFEVVLKDSNSRIKEILDERALKELLETKGKSFVKPWFGQLMTGPQLIAYILQLNMWLDRYHPHFEI